MTESSGGPCLCRSDKGPVVAGQLMEGFFFLNGGRLGGSEGSGRRGGRGNCGYAK